ncbi:MAG: MDR family MFS transporter [Pseudolysinimonas sp.]|uniref:MDR family MFS transporter n=1 Tax=Pseudolysinimonas sp. TaxID=2680009 RepID=UPI003265F3CE
MSNTTSTTTTTTSAKLDPAVIRIAIALLTGAIAVIFDTTIVAVALHQLAADLNTDVATIQWVSTGYLLALGVTIPLVGWLQSRLGGKRLWMMALTLFLIGSILCAAAWNVESLIAFRVVQGLGGGAMLPLLTTMIMQAARGQNISRLMATVALPTALGPILGPVIGGLILAVGSWQWLFLVNIPLGVVGLILAWRMLPADGPRKPIRLDVVGFVLLAPALVALLWGLSNVAGDGGFANVDVIAPLAAGVVLLVAFVLWALRKKLDPLLDLRVLRHRATWSATALMFLSGASLYGSMLLLPLYWQELRGADALGAGLLLIPQGVGSLLSRSLAARLMDRIGGRAVALLGFALVAVATVPFAFADGTTSIWLLGAILLVRGLGMGIVFIPLLAVAFLGLEHDEVPHASVITRIAQQIGGSLGVALLAVILAVSATAAGSLVVGFQIAFWWAVGFSVVSVGLAFILPGRPRTVVELTPEEVPKAAELA